LVATTFEDFSTGINIDLPQSTIREIKDVSEIQVVILANKELVLNYKEGGKVVQLKVNRNRLGEEIRNRLAASEQKSILISADKKIDYGFLVDIMTIVKETGATSLDLDTAELK
jgi:biopolymer transport protein ExbD